MLDFIIMQLITQLLIAQGLLFSVNRPVPIFDYKPAPAVKVVQQSEPVVDTIPAPKTVYTAPVQPTNDYKLFIYTHESNNTPNKINPTSGACGLGQALPCSKMPCSLMDYACQDNYFTEYMLSRYGSWYNAYIFWINHNYW